MTTIPKSLTIAGPLAGLAHVWPDYR